MKNFSTILLTATVILIASLADAQCDTLRHNQTWFDGWISCEETTSPNPVRGEGHWIQYDFGQQYALYELLVWNMNATDILDYGMQNVTIDISSDGVNWIEYGSYVFPQAPGDSKYEGHEVMTFDSTQAQYVLITAVDNYGGDCFGLSEIRIRASELCPEDKVEWISGNGMWDVPSNWCGNKIPTEEDEVVIPSGVKVTVPLFYTAHVWTVTLDPSSELEVIGNLVAHKPD